MGCIRPTMNPVMAVNAKCGEVVGVGAGLYYGKGNNVMDVDEAFFLPTSLAHSLVPQPDNTYRLCPFR